MRWWSSSSSPSSSLLVIICVYARKTLSLLLSASLARLFALLFEKRENLLVIARRPAPMAAAPDFFLSLSVFLLCLFLLSFFALVTASRVCISNFVRLSVSSSAPLCPSSWHLTSAVACMNIYPFLSLSCSVCVCAFTFVCRRRRRKRWVTLLHRTEGQWRSI